MDAPGQSVQQASALVTAVMKLRGYPADDQDEAMEALSVEHGPTLSRYREARLTSERARVGSASTDDLRNAMLQYRALFQELAARSEQAGERQDGDAGRRTDDPGVSSAGPVDDTTAGRGPVTSPATSTTADGAAAADTVGPADDAAPDSVVTGDAVSP